MSTYLLFPRPVGEGHYKLPSVVCPSVRPSVCGVPRITREQKGLGSPNLARWQPITRVTIKWTYLEVKRSKVTRPESINVRQIEAVWRANETAQSSEREVSKYHRQRGSDCTVLTATGLVNGEWQILTPTESRPLNRSTKNFAHVITSASRRATPNLVQIRPRGASGQIGEI